MSRSPFYVESESQWLRKTCRTRARLREAAVAFGDQRIYASHHSIMFSRRSCVRVQWTGTQKPKAKNKGKRKKEKGRRKKRRRLVPSA
jgi:hypothetical protein